MSITNASYFRVYFSILAEDGHDMEVTSKLLKKARLNLLQEVIKIQKAEVETGTIEKYPEKFRRDTFTIEQWEGISLTLSEVFEYFLKRAFEKGNFVDFTISPEWFKKNINLFGSCCIKPTQFNWETNYARECWVWKPAKEILKSLKEFSTDWQIRVREEEPYLELLICTDEEIEAYRKIGFLPYK